MTHCPAAPFSRRADRPPAKGGGGSPMTPAAAISRDHPDTLFATPSIVADRRADGSILLRSTVPLGDSARCVGDWLEHWARATPERIFLGERGNADAAMDHRHLQGCAQNRAVGRGLDSGARAERGPSPCHSRRQQRRSRAVGAGGDACRRALGRDLAGLFADVPGLRQAEEHDRPAASPARSMFPAQSRSRRRSRDQAAASGENRQRQRR